MKQEMWVASESFYERLGFFFFLLFLQASERNIELLTQWF